MPNDQLPQDAYLHQDLLRSGIELPVNILDTLCRRGLSLTFILSLLAFVALQLLSVAAEPAAGLLHLITVCKWLLGCYMVYYAARYVFAMHLRLQLRKNTPPLAVESYAVVVFPARLPRFCGRRSAVVYRECGSRSPRFFTGAVRSGPLPEMVRGQLAVVFHHHRHPRWYTVDDENAYQTAAGRGAVFERLAFGELPKGTVEGRMIRVKNDEEEGVRRSS